MLQEALHTNYKDLTSNKDAQCGAKYSSYSMNNNCKHGGQGAGKGCPFISEGTQSGLALFLEQLGNIIIILIIHDPQSSIATTRNLLCGNTHQVHTYIDK